MTAPVETANATGSRPDVLNSSDSIRVPIARASAEPAATPATEATIPRHITVRMTSPGEAPNAARTPISRVRDATTYETTEYTPTAASSRLNAPKAESTDAPRRHERALGSIKDS